MKMRIAGSLICAITALSGCTTHPLDDSAWVEPRPLGSDLTVYRPPNSVKSESEVASANEPTGMLSLRDALAAALMSSPDLAATGYEVRAVEAEALQAGVLPNPEVEVEFEDFGGTGELGGTDSIETTLALSQLVELGGKRVKRQRVATLEARLAGWDYEVRRIDVLTKTAADYVGMLAAERALETANESQRLAQRVADVVGERVRAGDESPVEATKAAVGLSQARLARDQALRDMAIARIRLSSNWGTIDSQFDQLTGDFESILSLPDYDKLVDRVDQNPDLARWAADIARRQAEVELALAQRVPDVTVAGGLRYYNEIDEYAFVAALSLPLQIFDQNEDGIRASRMRALQGSHLEDAARVQVRFALTEMYASLRSAYVVVTTTRDEILPNAVSAFEAAEEAFRQGKIDALDLLDAERTLFVVRGQLTESLLTYHLAVIGCERLIGAPLHGGDANDAGESQ